MQISVIGTGYVGLVTGACFAKMGNKVTCIDIDADKIALLNNGRIPFYEPGLEELVNEGIQSRNLFFTDQYEKGLRHAEICFLALPTPTAEGDQCDVTFVFSAVEQLAKIINNDLVIVNKSTVPVGTVEKLRQTIRKTLLNRHMDIPFDLVSNPEFLREGSAIKDCLFPDRIIIGTNSEKAKRLMQKIYAPFYRKNEEILLFMDIASAELSKYAANAMLATRISLMNELSLICEKFEADIDQVRRAMGKDPRIGSQYLDPGIGFGGSCLPKDIKALTASAMQYKCQVPILQSVLVINERQRKIFFQKILQHFGQLSEKTFALWGLSFKPNTDDMREAPSVFFIHQLLKKGAYLRLYDPVAIPKAKLLFKEEVNQIIFCHDEYEAAQGADAVVLITEWEQFRLVNFVLLGQLMREKVFFDGRNQYDPKEMSRNGFTYYCLGRKSQQKETAQEVPVAG